MNSITVPIVLRNFSCKSLRELVLFDYENQDPSLLARLLNCHPRLRSLRFECGSSKFVLSFVSTLNFNHRLEKLSIVLHSETLKEYNTYCSLLAMVLTLYSRLRSSDFQHGYSGYHSQRDYSLDKLSIHAVENHKTLSRLIWDRRIGEWGTNELLCYYTMRNEHHKLHTVPIAGMISQVGGGLSSHVGGHGKEIRDQHYLSIILDTLRARDDWCPKFVDEDKADADPSVYEDATGTATVANDR
jgi:hypothetical protein